MVRALASSAPPRIATTGAACAVAFLVTRGPRHGTGGGDGGAAEVAGLPVDGPGDADPLGAAADVPGAPGVAVGTDVVPGAGAGVALGVADGEPLGAGAGSSAAPSRSPTPFTKSFQPSTIGLPVFSPSAADGVGVPVRPSAGAEAARLPALPGARGAVVGAGLPAAPVPVVRAGRSASGRVLVGAAADRDGNPFGQSGSAR